MFITYHVLAKATYRDIAGFLLTLFDPGNLIGNDDLSRVSIMVIAVWSRGDTSPSSETRTRSWPLDNEGVTRLTTPSNTVTTLMAGLNNVHIVIVTTKCSTCLICSVWYRVTNRVAIIGQ